MAGSSLYWYSSLITEGIVESNAFCTTFALFFTYGLESTKVSNAEPVISVIFFAFVKRDLAFWPNV